MRAAVVHRYGPPEVVRVVDLPSPHPRGDELLVRVRSTTVSIADSRIRAARFPSGYGILGRLALGIRGPRHHVLGGAFSGVVEAIGPEADGFDVGDDACGMLGVRMGAHAEHLVVPAAKATRKPPAVSHDDAAGVVFGGASALYFLRDRGRVGHGSRVLVNGASGAVGTSAVQLARHLGATVTGVTSTANAALVRDLGASRVIDHTRTSVAQDAERYDLVLDTVGNLSIADGRGLLAPGGKLLLVVDTLSKRLRARGDVVAGLAPEDPEDFDLLLALVAAGELTVVKDQAFGLDDIVEAHRLVDTGHKVGNVLLHP